MVSGYAGDGGASGQSYGGGIADSDYGELSLFHGSVDYNISFHAPGGAGGNSPVFGNSFTGKTGDAFGGGIAVLSPPAQSVVTKSQDTNVAGNFADTFPDIYGKIVIF